MSASNKNTNQQSIPTNTQSIYLDDTVQTFMFQKQALQIKLQHNIAQLSNKNTYLTTILKQLCTKQYEDIKEDCQTVKDLIKLCRSLGDDLNGLDILQKKTQILKAQVFALAYRFNQVRVSKLNNQQPKNQNEINAKDLKQSAQVRKT